MWLSSAAPPKRMQTQTPPAERHERMVEAAHELLAHDDIAGAEAVEPLVALADHMDSFPLLPLPLIPRLSLSDLQACERALQQLLESLSNSSDDVRLAKYAGRQLSLVQRQAEQTRARERVLQLLRGEVPAPGVRPIETMRDLSARRSPRAQSNANPALRPRSGCLTTVAAGGGPTACVTSSASASMSSATAPVMKDVAKKKKDAIEAAKALIQSNLKRCASAGSHHKSTSVTPSGSVSPFVISAGEHSGYKRRGQQRRKRKPTPAEQEEARARQVEKERERRRHEAYQRLLARQELQAAKKKKAEQQQVAIDSGLLQKDVQDIKQLSSAQPEHHGPRNSRGSRTDESESESDVSDVSNCSDSDEANEKTIMALEVAPRAEETREEETDDKDAVPAERSGSEDGDDGNLLGDGVDTDETDAIDEAECMTASTVASIGVHDTRCGRSAVLGGDDNDSRPEIEDGVRDALSTTTCLHERHGSGDREEQHDGEESAPTARSSDSNDFHQWQIEQDLQAFIASRKAAMMEQLQRQAGQHRQPMTESPRSSATDTGTSMIIHPSSISISERNQHEDGCDPRCGLSLLEEDTPQTRGEDSGDLNDKPPAAPDDAPSAHLKAARHHLHPSTRTGVASGCPNRVPRLVAKPCKDYRSYFSNFHCILTGVFEQRHAFRNTSSSREALLSSSLSQPPPVHDPSLRIQLKLYESWQSIMHDYATVFGGTITTPSSLLPPTSSGAPSALSSFTAHYRINSTTRREVCDIVVTALDKLGDWDEHPSGLGLKTTWNLLWTWSKPRVERKTLLVWQKVNHFQHAKALTRKDCLKKNMGRYLAMGGKMKQAYDIVPLTFILPQEYIAFVQAFQDKGARLERKWEESAKLGGSRGAPPSGKNIWIMKPVALSRGRGISLINDLSQVVYGEQVVIQEYIANPLLLDGYKFDLRLYVLVTSFNPLEAFFYDEGFVRICTRQYEDTDLSNLFVHLTNSSIQKENQDAIESSDNPINAAAGEEAGGTKMTLAYLWKRLEAMGADVAKVRRDIDDVVLKSLLCGEDHIPFQVNSFDLYGYDILLDDTFRPWLIEINSSPSMARENALDYQARRCHSTTCLQSPPLRVLKLRPRVLLVALVCGSADERRTDPGHDQARKPTAFRPRQVRRSREPATRGPREREEAAARAHSPPEGRRRACNAAAQRRPDRDPAGPGAALLRRAARAPRQLPAPLSPHLQLQPARQAQEELRAHGAQGVSRRRHHVPFVAKSCTRAVGCVCTSLRLGPAARRPLFLLAKVDSERVAGVVDCRLDRCVRHEARTEAYGRGDAEHDDRLAAGAPHVAEDVDLRDSRDHERDAAEHHAPVPRDLVEERELGGRRRRRRARRRRDLRHDAHLEHEWAGDDRAADAKETGDHACQHAAEREVHRCLAGPLDVAGDKLKAERALVRPALAHVHDKERCEAEHPRDLRPEHNPVRDAAALRLGAADARRDDTEVAHEDGRVLWPAEVPLGFQQVTQLLLAVLHERARVLLRADAHFHVRVRCPGLLERRIVQRRRRHGSSRSTTSSSSGGGARGLLRCRLLVVEFDALLHCAHARGCEQQHEKNRDDVGRQELGEEGADDGAAHHRRDHGDANVRVHERAVGERVALAQVEDGVRHGAAHDDKVGGRRGELDVKAHDKHEQRHEDGAAADATGRSGCESDDHERHRERIVAVEGGERLEIVFGLRRGGRAGANHNHHHHHHHQRRRKRQRTHDACGVVSENVELSCEIAVVSVVE
ncbi:hypothetical protein PybrP1_002701 [[Pythium] brassicae (nom. inval.)]|nr:hypothetical protein PybrP1_002701 [[Pythium] brassicae (nom. inval.)]